MFGAVPVTHHIVGELKAEFYSWTGSAVSTQTTKFDISIAGSRWLLKSEYATNWFWLVGGDGTNTYSVLVDPKAPRIPAPATVFFGDFPVAAFDTVSVPWMAFCSSHFLSRSPEKNSIPSLWTQAQIDPMAHVCSTDVINFTLPPYLPSGIDWITSSSQIASAASNYLLRTEGATVPELNRRSLDYKASVLAGKLLGRYRVVDYTNINGTILPLKFALKAYGYLTKERREAAQYALDQISKTNRSMGRVLQDTYLVASYIGNVINIHSDNYPVMLPEPKLRMSVADYRVSSKSNGIDHISYYATTWKPEIDDKMRDLLKIKIRNPPQVQELPGSKSRLLSAALRIFIFAGALAPLFIWGLWRVKERNANKKRKEYNENS
jgi:hypothetical protein